MACWLVVLLFMVIATAHLVSQNLAFLQQLIPGPLCQSASACFKDLQRSSENLKVSKGIQGDPRGSPWGSKGLVFQYFQPRLIRLDMSLTGLEFRAAVVLVSAGPALTAFAAQQWRLHTVGGSWQEQG